MASAPNLQDQILAALSHAASEHDWEVAEFLLQALEALARRQEDASHVESAYLELLREIRSRSQ